MKKSVFIKRTAFMGKFESIQRPILKFYDSQCSQRTQHIQTETGYLILNVKTETRNLYLNVETEIIDFDHYESL